MDEKKRIIWDFCRFVGFVALVVYTVLIFVGSSPYLLVIRLILAGIAAIAFAIMLVVGILSKQYCTHPVLWFAVCLLNIVLTAMQL